MSKIHNARAVRWRFRRSRGIALVVILILLMAITTVVVFSAQRAVVGESSARNQMDYEVARQAAEAALRDGERDVLLDFFRDPPDSDPCGRNVENRFGPIYFQSDCPNGQCSEARGEHKWEKDKNNTNAEHWWPAEYGGKWGDNSGSNFVASNFKGGVPFGKCTGKKEVTGVGYQPEYLLEYFHRDTPFIRITARGFGVTGDGTQVVLQSYVRLPLMNP